MNPTAIIKAPKKFKVETPIGSLESDSGNHMVDVFSVVIVIVVLYLGKHLFKKYIK